jgi:positive phototaxis protein PixI
MVEMNLVKENKAHLTPEASVDTTDLHQFLKFHLQPNFTAAIEITNNEKKIGIGSDSSPPIRVTEIINMQLDLVVPIPHLPPAVMGVYNWRGEILWVVDLSRLLGLTNRTIERHRYNFKPTIAISTTAKTGSETKTIGLVVDEIYEIEWYRSASIIEPIADRQHPELWRWMRGYTGAGAGEKLAILDGRVIMEHADIHADI